MSPEKGKKAAETAAQIAVITLGLGLSAGIGYLEYGRAIESTFSFVSSIVRQYIPPGGITKLEPPKTLTMERNSR